MFQEKLKELSQKVNEIAENVSNLLGELEQEQVEFADLASERLMGFDEERVVPKQYKGKNVGVDQGGFSVKVVLQAKIMEDHPRLDLTQTNRLLSLEQLCAFSQRVASLKRFIGLCTDTGFLPTSWDLITNADQMYGAHLNALKRNNPARALSQRRNVIDYKRPTIALEFGL